MGFQVDLKALREENVRMRGDAALVLGPNLAPRAPVARNISRNQQSFLQLERQISCLQEMVHSLREENAKLKSASPMSQSCSALGPADLNAEMEKLKHENEE